MKIMRNNMSLFRMEGASHTRSDSRVQSGAKGNGNYDAITIQSSSRQIQEKTCSVQTGRVGGRTGGIPGEGGSSKAAGGRGNLSCGPLSDCIQDAAVWGGICPWLI